MSRWSYGVLALQLAGGSAQAATGLAWQWEEGVHRRYLVKAAVVLPESIPFNAKVNSDAMIAAFSVTMVLDCAPAAPPGKAAVELRCDIEAASLVVTPLPTSVGIAGPIAQEWSSVLADRAWLQVLQSRDGRIKSVDLEDVDTSIDRYQRIAEYMRQFSLRALAPMDLQLPKKGETGAEPAWPQTSGLAYGMPSFSGGNASVRWVHQLQGEEAGVVSWTFHADGVLMPGGDLGDQVSNTFSQTLDGSARFDTRRGVLLEGQFVSEAQATAGSMQAAASRTGFYTQRSYIQLLEDGSSPTLAPAGEGN